MELSDGCSCWSVLLQLVVIVICYQGNVSSERSQDCVGSQLILECPEMEVIEITAVVLGKQMCWTSCCIKNSDCTGDANENHRTDVYRRCNNRRSCSVYPTRDRIRCGTWSSWSDNDFERITYDCTDDPQGLTAATSSWVSSTSEDTTDGTSRSTDDQNTTDSDQDVEGHGGDIQESNLSGVVSVVMGTVGLAVLTSIIVAIVMLRRKRNRRVKSSVIKTERKETDYVNEDQITSLNQSEAQDYCDLERMATEGIQSDSEYEKLDRGKNYEPLVVYEQLQ